jgi:hypothetical protein
MTKQSLSDRPVRSTTVLFALLATGLLSLSACASAPASSVSMTPDMSTSPPSPDPRIGLRAGHLDAEQAAWNMTLLSNTPPAEGFVGVTNSDLAFSGNYVYPGQLQRLPGVGRQQPAPADAHNVVSLPRRRRAMYPVYRNLLFVSGEGRPAGSTAARRACRTPSVRAAARHPHLRCHGRDEPEVRRERADVPRLAHAHVATDPRDSRQRLHLRVRLVARAFAQRAARLLGAGAGRGPELGAVPHRGDPRAARAPQQAAIVSSPRIFNDLAAPPRRGQPASRGRQPRPGGRGGASADRTEPVPRHHDYPAVGLAGGACGGYGLLLDISDVANPRRIDAAADSNMSFWHSATFSNDGDKVLFTDEWGGGRCSRCRATDRLRVGRERAVHHRERPDELPSYYKMPAAQTEWENCVAHNGSLIPIPDREVMVQAWYQGGISSSTGRTSINPKEIAFFDRGPLEDGELTSAGSWSVYWYNGHIISSEIARGLDVSP